MGNSYSQLTLDERYQIKALSELNYSARKIAHKLRRSNKTISRELKHYSFGTYRAEMAHKSACHRRKNAAKAHKRSAELIRKTKALLELNMTLNKLRGE